MINVNLIKPSIEYKEQVMEYRNQFITIKDNLAGASYLQNYSEYEDWLSFVLDNEKEDTKHTEVTANVFLAVNDKNNLVGIINIRHSLNDYLFNYGGHIGYSVKIEERRKGYANEILRLGLVKCQYINIKNVLITCDKNNIGSAKTIVGNGGELENEILHDGIIKQRYWITLN